MAENSFRQYCEQQNKENLLRECNLPENEAFDPGSVGAASHRILWWQCEKGHKWQAPISTRTTKGKNCPYCANKKVLKGYNDLATLCPETAAQWHPEKNGGIRPEDVVCGSEKKVWWQCDKGHEWQATVENRALKKQRCPYCSGKKAWPGYNDLATLCPELMKEWHPTLNEGIDPTRLRPRSAKRVWWQCAQGHVWDATISNRNAPTKPGCPVCAGNQRVGKTAELVAKAAEHEI